MHLLYENRYSKPALSAAFLDYNLPANYVDQQNKILANMTKEQISAMSKNVDLPKWTSHGWRQSENLRRRKKLGCSRIIELDADGKKVEKKDSDITLFKKKNLH